MCKFPIDRGTDDQFYRLESERGIKEGGKWVIADGKRIKGD